MNINIYKSEYTENWHKTVVCDRCKRIIASAQCNKKPREDEVSICRKGGEVMAIELHHLNTHGMMEQAGDVLDGVVRLKQRIAELEEERRWRKFPDEKPKEEMEGEDFLVSNGYYSVVCEWRGYWNNEPFCGDKNCDVVKYWKPLTQAPKEEK